MFKEPHSDDDKKENDISKEKTLTIPVPSTKLIKQSSLSSF
jgi:hypothetical protein